jgi:hypothetical protein
MRMICSYFLNLICDTMVLTYFGKYKSEKNTAALFLVEKQWILLWISVQFICFILAFFGCLISYIWPVLLLNQWWTYMNNVTFVYLIKLQILLFFSVVFIDIYPYIYKSLGMF